MAVSVFSSAGLSLAVSDLGNAQKTSRVRRQFVDAPEGVHMSETLEYGHDVRHPRVLHYRKPGEASGVVTASVGTLKSIRFPMLRESTAFGEIDARVLDPSIAQYAGRNNTDANANFTGMVMKQLEYLQELIDNTHLLSCYAALQTGVVTFNYKDAPDETIDFGFGSAGTAVTSIIRTALSGTTAPTAIWTHANALPMKNIDTLASDARATSKYSGAFDVLMGRAAWDAFSVHSTVTNMLDNRRIDSGNMKLREDAEWKANINGYDIYLVDTRYLLNTTWTDMWNTNTIALVPREPTGWFSTEYGAPFEIPVPGADPAFLPTKYFSKTFTEEDPAVKKILVEARPIPLIKNPLCMRVQAVIS